MSEKVKHATDADFEDVVLKSDKPVLVDFWAPWCGPCKVVGPILEELAQDYDGKAKIVKVNVDEEKETAGALGIRSIPTVVLYNNGEVVDTFIGARPKDEFVNLLKKIVVD